MDIKRESAAITKVIKSSALSDKSPQENNSPKPGAKRLSGPNNKTQTETPSSVNEREDGKDVQKPPPAVLAKTKRLSQGLQVETKPVNKDRQSKTIDESSPEGPSPKSPDTLLDKEKILKPQTDVVAPRSLKPKMNMSADEEKKTLEVRLLLMSLTNDLLSSLCTTWTNN